MEDTEVGLVGYWKINEGYGNILYDNSTYKNHGISKNMDSSDWITGLGTCRTISCSAQMTQKPTITIANNPTSQSLSIDQSSFCDAGSTTINLASSEKDTRYYLRDNADDAVIEGPILGTGSGISFNTGLISNSTAYNIYTERHFRSTLDFDGINDHVEIPHHEDYNLIDSFTVSLWFKSADTLQNGKYLFNKGNNYAILYNYLPNTIEFYSGYYSGDYPRTGSQMTINDTLWHHVSYTYDGITLKGYIDGVQQIAVAKNFTIATSLSALLLGTAEANAGNVNGQLDEFRIWEITRTAAEINADKNTTLTGTETGLVAYWNMNEGTAYSLYDETKNTNHGQLKNMDASTDWITGIGTPSLTCSTQMPTITTITKNPCNDYCNGDLFRDSGGASFDYPPNENITTTICPENVGEVISLHFTEFNTESNGSSNCYDGLTIHNGNSTSAPSIPSPRGSVDVWCWDRGIASPTGTGDLQDKTIISTDASGCLTFVFNSNASVARTGFQAMVTCGLPTLPPTDVMAQAGGKLSSDAVVIDGDGWHHFYNISSTVNLISLQLGNTGAQIPITGVEVNASGTGVINMGTNGCQAPYVTSPDWYVFERTWNADPDIQPSSPVNVRMYYTDAEFAAVDAVSSDISAHKDLTFYKINGGDEEDFTVSGNGCHDLVDPSNYEQFTTGTWIHATYGSAHYAQFPVTEFSGGGGGGGTGRRGALPIELISFTGKIDATKNRLKWITASEENVEKFVLERSENGMDFRAIASIKAQGFSTELQNYERLDEQPFLRTYYRLKIVEFDASFDYSKILIIDRPNTENGILSIYPIPTFDILQVEFLAAEAGEMEFTLTNISGKTMQKIKTDTEIGVNHMNLDLAQYSTGIYFLHTTIKGNRKVYKIVKQ